MPRNESSLDNADIRAEARRILKDLLTEILPLDREKQDKLTTEPLTVSGFKSKQLKLRPIANCFPTPVFRKEVKKTFIAAGGTELQWSKILSRYVSKKARATMVEWPSDKWVEFLWRVLDELGGVSKTQEE